MVSFSTINRITGLATGLDTDSMVKELMKAERMPLDKLYQKKQKLEWQRDSYRDMTNLIRGFRDEFFSVLKPQSNILSESSFFKFNTSSSDDELVTVTGTAEAASGSHAITVKSLATAANISSTGTVSAPLKGTAAAETDFTNGNNKFLVVLDGVLKTISLGTDAAYADANDLVNNATDGIQKLINDAFGAGKITVSADGSGVLSFTPTSSGSKIVLGDSESNNALGKLKFASGDSNGLNLTSSLESMANRFSTGLTFDADNNLKFSINNVEFTFNKSTTLKDMMNTINTSAAGVTMTYSQLTDSFTMTSKQTGTGNGITITNTGGNFFDADPANAASGIKTGTVSNGSDALFDLDGILNITRSDNSFTIDGVKYNLLKAEDPPVEVTVGLTQDVEGVYNNIKSFVDKYNEMIEKINAQLDQALYRDYQPLTDEQKDELSEDEIKKWEEKAKSGVLRNDPLLEKFVKDMRGAIFAGIEGVSGIITDIGISTGSWQDKGKLVIDETKLKKAIQNDPNKVKDLFMRESTIEYSTELTSEERTQRFKESGIAQRLNDVITENIRLSRDSRGNKGFLIEKAGVAGISDASEFDNLITNDINKTDTRIADLTDLLNQKEDNYYKRFAALEEAINRMNQQSAWLSQQFGSNG